MKHMTAGECAIRFPRLVRALKWTMIASLSESACCIRDYRDGIKYGGECISHSGLTNKDRVQDAIRARHAVLACVRDYGIS